MHFIDLRNFENFGWKFADLRSGYFIFFPMWRGTVKNWYFFAQNCSKLAKNYCLFRCVLWIWEISKISAESPPICGPDTSFFFRCGAETSKIDIFLPKIAPNWLKMSHFVYLGAFYGFEKFRTFRPKVRRFAVPILLFFPDVPRKRQKLIFFCPKLLQIG